jgi:hypothetical protein
MHYKKIYRKIIFDFSEMLLPFENLFIVLLNI